MTNVVAISRPLRLAFLADAAASGVDGTRLLGRGLINAQP